MKFKSSDQPLSYVPYKTRINKAFYERSCDNLTDENNSDYWRMRI